MNYRLNDGDTVKFPNGVEIEVRGDLLSVTLSDDYLFTTDHMSRSFTIGVEERD